MVGCKLTPVGIYSIMATIHCIAVWVEEKY